MTVKFATKKEEARSKDPVMVANKILSTKKIDQTTKPKVVIQTINPEAIAKEKNTLIDDKIFLNHKVLRLLVDEELLEGMNASWMTYSRKKLLASNILEQMRKDNINHIKLKGIAPKKFLLTFD